MYNRELTDLVAFQSPFIQLSALEVVALMMDRAVEERDACDLKIMFEDSVVGSVFMTFEDKLLELRAFWT